MQGQQLKQSSWRWLWRCTLVVAAGALVAWQFFTLLEVVQMHTAQAQKLSRSAGWSNQPVGTMPQPSSDRASTAQHRMTSDADRHMLRTALP